MIGTLIGGLAQLGGGIAGAISASDARNEAANLIRASVADYEAMGVPSEQALQLSLERYRNEGILTPEMEQEITQGDSRLLGIQEDPRLREAQLSALDELGSIGRGETRLSDKAAVADILDKTAQAERGQRLAIEQDLRQRGAYGSGAELAMKLANQQSSAQQANQQGLNLAAQAQDRALKAIIEGGNLGGNIRGQEFSQSARAAEAQDAINRYNAMARGETQQRNIANRNDAQKYNLGMAQDISNKNVDLTNMEQQSKSQSAQQMFNNKLALNQAKANARGQQASNTISGGLAQAQMFGGAGAGIGQIGSEYDRMKRYEEDRKNRV
jgi:hypothetical protein